MVTAVLIALIEPLARRFFGEPDSARSRNSVLYFGSHGQLEVDVKWGRWFDHDTKKAAARLTSSSRKSAVRATPSVSNG